MCTHAVHPVDEKHYSDAMRLAQYCGRPTPTVPASGLEVQQYTRDTGRTCSRCQASRQPDFPLAYKRRIVAIMGYV
jgi:hypothetical protein